MSVSRHALRFGRPTNASHNMCAAERDCCLALASSRLPKIRKIKRYTALPSLDYSTGPRCTIALQRMYRVIRRVKHVPCSVVHTCPDVAFKLRATFTSLFSTIEGRNLDISIPTKVRGLMSLFSSPFKGKRRNVAVGKLI